MKAKITLKTESDMLLKYPLLHQRREYELARLTAMARLQTGYDLQWTPPRSRDELYER